MCTSTVLLFGCLGTPASSPFSVSWLSFLRSSRQMCLIWLSWSLTDHYSGYLQHFISVDAVQTPFPMLSQGLNTLCHEDRARTRLSGLTRSSFTHAAAPGEEQTRLLPWEKAWMGQKGSQRRQRLSHLASLSSTAAVWGLEVTVAGSPGPSPPSHSRFLPRLQFKIQHPDTCSPHPTTLIKSTP